MTIVRRLHRERASASRSPASRTVVDSTAFPCLAAAVAIALAMGTARAAQPKVVGYIDAGGEPAYLSNLASSDYTHVIAGFISPSSTTGMLGYDTMGTWMWNPTTQTSDYFPQTLNAGFATAINAAQAGGKRVLLSFGGAGGWSGGDPGYSFWASGTAPAALAAQLAGYVTNPTVQTGGPAVHFDGIDIDFEDTAALQGTGYDGVQFLVTLTTELRARLPSNQYVIFHAPQAPYFLTSFSGTGGMYQAVNAQVGDKIDFYNVQMYNNPAFDGNGVPSGVVAAYGTVLANNPSLPASKALLGLPMQAGLADNNVFSLADQASIFLQARQQYGAGGAMGWQVYNLTNPTLALGPAWASNAATSLASAGVPEIDPAGMAAVRAIVCGALGLHERRRAKARAA